MYIKHLSVIITLLLLSCQNKENSDRDHLVFRYNENANITSLDPAFSVSKSNIWGCNQLYNGLIRLDDNLNIKPDIAKKWNISEDGLSYTFTLRNDVYFHKSKLFGADKTRTVKAADFEYSFKRLTDEKVASPGGWILQNVAQFKAENDSIFTIQLKKSFPAFLGLLSMKYASVVPKELKHNPNYNFRSNPIGTGPFQFKIWAENVKLVFRKNPLYFEKDTKGVQLPYLEAVAITFLPDKQSGFLGFIQGKMDYIWSLDQSYKDEIITATGELQPKYQNTVDMTTGPYLNTEYLGFQMDNPNSPIHDKRIRQALNYGFDRVKLVKYLRNGMGTPATSGIIPKGLPSYNGQKGYDYQPEKATSLIKSYLSEKQLTEIPEIKLSTISLYIDIAEYLQREWQKLGVKVTIDINPPSTLRQIVSTGKTSFFRASWIADYPDAENYLSLFYSKNFAPNGPNYTHFKNDKFDKLYELSLSTVDPTERYALYQKMDSIVINEAPVIPLFYDKVVRFTRKNVKNVGINPLDLLELKYVQKTPHQ